LKSCKVKTKEEKAAYASMAGEMKAAWPMHLPFFVEGLERAAELLAAEDVSDEAIAAVLAAAEEVPSSYSSQSHS
jgi:hypothetical protein